jgi:hypothetical protein
MVSSFLSRAGVQLVCIFRFFFAIVSPVRGRRALRRAPGGGSGAPRSSAVIAACRAANTRPGKGLKARHDPIVHISLTCVTRIVRGRFEIGGVVG